VIVQAKEREDLIDGIDQIGFIDPRRLILPSWCR
jgi:Ni,Fe-hydrogenase III component G